MPTRAQKRVYQPPETSQQRGIGAYKLTTVIMREKRSRCWSSKKFNTIAHPDLKNMASCKLCYEEAQVDSEKEFIIPYKVDKWTVI